MLVFKAVSGVAPPGSSNSMLNDPYIAWSTPAPLNEDIPIARQLDNVFKGHYKSSFTLNWERRNIIEVFQEKKFYTLKHFDHFKTNPTDRYFQ